MFDAVVMDDAGRVLRIDVKQSRPGSRWIWGAFRMSGRVLHELHALWCARSRRDEYIGTLINAWIEQGGVAHGVCAGARYVDVGTLGGYREAIRLLESRRLTARPQPAPPKVTHGSERFA